jgi:pyruvate,water dikinase
MRSSAQGEDMSGRSFAGQYRSELNVSSDNVSQVYKEILASKYSLPAMTYRLNRGIPDRGVSMSVGCMAMVDAVSSGVAYTRNPLDIRDESIIINSVWGLPKPVVDGSVVADLFVISRDDPPEIINKKISFKKEKFICYPDEGVCRLNAIGDEESGLPSLDDQQAIELSLLTRQIEDYYGQPQDIEWALEADGGIVFLQSRPLKQMEAPEITEKPSVPDEKQHEVIFTGGISASPGAGAGAVFMVNRDADAFQFPEGAVLVTPQAQPRWAFLLNRAAAVVTGQGGVTGHLANVAREFNVPALFGVEEGIAELKQGERVTVDADGLRIYRGDLEDLLTSQVKPVNLMEGSPVYAILKNVARHITPLYLLDPDAANFRVRECRTLHDITRYCHEKAVHEMFQFGKEHHFPERSSKQLYHDVPMQWWILNLDDGFKEEEEGKYIRLENIVSTPMLALWEGLAAIPWQGPPAIDAKGFMSVMFQATTNRGLTQGLRSRFADRNYFMISKNYCSLSSRLGFHFSLVEAMVGERLTENYTSFQYKGGAADIERRLKRLRLLKGILEDNGFSATMNKDSLIARVEGLDQESMKTKLKILGYLLIHTRQIDMIMANSASVEFYRSKLEKDIAGIVG